MIWLPKYAGSIISTAGLGASCPAWPSAKRGIRRVQIPTYLRRTLSTYIQYSTPRILRQTHILVTMALTQCLKHMRALHTSIPSQRHVVPLAYEVHGRGKPNSSHHDPILFLHGFLGSKRENRRVSRYISANVTGPSSNWWC